MPVSVFRGGVSFINGIAQCTISIGRAIGGMDFVRCIEVVRLSESPLLEVSLYDSMNKVDIMSISATVSVGKVSLYKYNVK